MTSKTITLDGEDRRSLEHRGGNLREDEDPPDIVYGSEMTARLRTTTSSMCGGNFSNIRSLEMVALLENRNVLRKYGLRGASGNFPEA